MAKSKKQSNSGKDQSEAQVAKAQSKSSSYIKFLLPLFASISAILFLILLSVANLLPTNLLALIILIILSLLALTSWKLLREKTRKAPRVFFKTLTIILSIIYIIASIYLSSTIAILRDLTSQKTTETRTYSVLTLKSKNFHNIKDLEGQKIGFQATDQTRLLSEQKLKESINYEIAAYENLGSMMIALTREDVAAITITSTYLMTLKEDQPDFYETISELYTFEILYQTKTTSNQNQTDIASEPFILYLSGSDSYSTLTDQDRSDVNMLIVANPKTNKLLLVSIPRDYYVKLSGTTGLKDKLTHAGMYGNNTTKATIEELFNIKINYIARVGFDAVRNLVDALGGINIYSDTEFKARNYGESGCYFIEGNNHVNGTCALAFARERYSYYTGDLHRIENQQQVLNGIIKKIIQPENIIRYNELLSTLQGSFITDLTYENITNFAKQQLSTMKNWNIETISVTGTESREPTYSFGDQRLFVFIPDQSSIDAAIEKINAVLNEGN